MPKTVIVNSTPLIALSSINQLALLRELYDIIIIPNAVKTEIEAKNGSKAHKDLELHSEWIHIKEIKNINQKHIFKTQLHDGEVEVMILGQELNADLLIIDDYVAREYVKYLGFKVVGTVGILLKAKATGLINEVKPLLDKLVTNGIYISERLYAEVLKTADE